MCSLPIASETPDQRHHMSIGSSSDINTGLGHVHAISIGYLLQQVQMVYSLDTHIRM